MSQDWKIATTMLVLLALGGVWRVSGRDPIWWLIRLLILVRAALSQLAAELMRAAARWWRSMPAAIDRSRRACLEVD